MKEVVQSHKWHLVFFGVAHAVILPIIFNTVYQITFSSTGLYMDYASKVLGGSIPYHDFALEYPPFSMAFLILPRLFTTSFSVYTVVYQIEVFLFDLLGLYLIYRIARNRGEAPWKMLMAYSLAILAIGPIITKWYDIFPAIIVLLAIYYFQAGRYKTGWFLLALGTMTKIYPIAIAPILFIHHLCNHEYKHVWSGISVFIATSLATIAPFIIISPGSLLNLITYHTQRGIQLETTYSSFLLTAGKISSSPPQLTFGAGSWNVIGPLADNLASISTFVLVFFLLVTYWFIYRQINKDKNQFRDIGSYSILVIAVILITSKVLSPQYLIWLFPLLPLLSGRQRYVMWGIFIVIGALTYYIFPLHYVELIYLENEAVAILLLRNVLLVLLTVLIGISAVARSEIPTIKQPI